MPSSRCSSKIIRQSNQHQAKNKDLGEVSRLGLHQTRKANALKLLKKQNA